MYIHTYIKINKNFTKIAQKGFGFQFEEVIK